MRARQDAPSLPGHGEAAAVWFRIGCLSFGGPAGQIALMHRELVETRHWVGDRQFLQALNFCSLLPGPEAQQLATYVGWLIHGASGGLVAGLLFILPGAAVMMGLSLLYATAGDVPVISGLFLGLTSAVLIIVFDAVRRVAARALVGPAPVTLAVAAFAALFLFDIPFPVVVLTAGMIGLALPGHFAAGGHGGARNGGADAVARAVAADPALVGRRARSARRAALIALAAWVGAVAILLAIGGVFADIGIFFSKMALVTFGGAYAVLSYVAQEAVANYAWLSGEQMLAGLGLAESTPGPLILVLQFVGFFAGLQTEAGLLTACFAAIATLWVTFAPCFAFVFAGAPAIESLGGRPRLAGGLAAITAAVVGVIANLGLWFSLHVLFAETVEARWGPLSIPVPALDSIDYVAVGLAALAAALLLGTKAGTVRTLLLCGGAGLILGWVDLAGV